MNIDRVLPALYVDNIGEGGWYFGRGGRVELRIGVGVESGWTDDDFEVFPFPDDFVGEGEYQVDFDGPFMDVVDD